MEELEVLEQIEGLESGYESGNFDLPNFLASDLNTLIQESGLPKFSAALNTTNLEEQELDTFKTNEITNPDLILYPGLIVYNTSTPTEDLLNTIYSINTESGEKGFEKIDTDDAIPYQFYYTGEEARLGKPFKGQIIQTITSKDAAFISGWKHLEDTDQEVDDLVVRHYIYNGAETIGKRTGYPGMIVVYSNDTAKDIKELYKGDWLELDDGIESSVKQFVKRTTKHLTISNNNTEVKVKYARQYSGKYLPSYEGMIVENNCSTEKDFNKVYGGEYACWDKVGSTKYGSYFWKRADTLYRPTSTKIQVLPGLVMQNFSTPTADRFNTLTGLTSTKAISGHSTDLETGKLDWRSNFQFAYTGDTISGRELKPYKGMIIQTTTPLTPTTDWTIIDAGTETGVYQYEYTPKTDTEDADLRPSYLGMIVIHNSKDSKGNFINAGKYYEGTWKALLTTAEAKEYELQQYIRTE